jgi:hypothetical protein
MYIQREWFLGSWQNRLGHVALQKLWDSINHGPGTGYQVEVREPIFQPITLLLGEATAQAQLQSRVLCFELMKGPEEAVHFVLGLLPDATGVQEDEVCILRPFCQFEPFFRQDASDLLRVGLIGLTAKGDQL